MDKNYILSPETASRKLRRMAYEILENNFAEKEIILAGIRVNGSVIARNIQTMLKEISTLSTELLTVNLNKQKPQLVTLEKALSFENKVVLLIDDVSNSGKTLLYALKPFLEADLKKIQTLYLSCKTRLCGPVRGYHPAGAYYSGSGS
jgi:pyrimidine operon attenuation protein / uracil phosphoribosyltransferase